MSRLEKTEEWKRNIEKTFEILSGNEADKETIETALKGATLEILTEAAISLTVIADHLTERKEAGEEKHPRADTERDCTRCIYLYDYETSDTCKECLTGAVNNFEPEDGK